MGTRTQQPPKFKTAKEVFGAHEGTLRTGQAVRSGIHPRTLYQMRDAGVIQELSRGLYRLAELPPIGNPDLASVALRAPKGVLCLLSALAYHDLTTQVPHEVHLALERDSRRPRFQYPPVRVFWFSPRMFREGIESHPVEGGVLRVYSAEKTLADCFRYRNKMGLDVAIEALRFYFERRRAKIDELLRFARVCRVENVMRPYLEALV